MSFKLKESRNHLHHKFTLIYCSSPQSVFKNFDTDGDGHISRDEFEAIRNNFPYLSKFGELDKNQWVLVCWQINPRASRKQSSPASALSLFPRDGKISREEMIDYFMKASSLLNCKMGFIHTFTETTYVKPTFCEHCAGFVSQHLLIFSQFYLTSGTDSGTRKTVH